MKQEQVVARLTVVVEYDTLPSQEAVQSVIEEGRANGAVVKAELEVVKPTTVDLK